MDEATLDEMADAALAGFNASPSPLASAPNLTSFVFHKNSGPIFALAEFWKLHEAVRASCLVRKAPKGYNNFIKNQFDKQAKYAAIRANENTAKEYKRVALLFFYLCENRPTYSSRSLWESKATLLETAMGLDTEYQQVEKLLNDALRADEKLENEEERFLGTPAEFDAMSKYVNSIGEGDKRLLGAGTNGRVVMAEKPGWAVKEFKFDFSMQTKGLKLIREGLSEDELNLLSMSTTNLNEIKIACLLREKAANDPTKFNHINQLTKIYISLEKGIAYGVMRLGELGDLWTVWFNLITYLLESGQWCQDGIDFLESVIWILNRGFILGLLELQKAGIAHRDSTWTNALLKKHVVLVIDLGYAGEIGPDSKMPTKVGFLVNDSVTNSQIDAVQVLNDFIERFEFVESAKFGAFADRTTLAHARELLDKIHDNEGNNDMKNFCAEALLDDDGLWSNDVVLKLVPTKPDGSPDWDEAHKSVATFYEQVVLPFIQQRKIEKGGKDVNIFAEDYVVRLAKKLKPNLPIFMRKVNARTHRAGKAKGASIPFRAAKKTGAKTAGAPFQIPAALAATVQAEQETKTDSDFSDGNEVGSRIPAAPAKGGQGRERGRGKSQPSSDSFEDDDVIITQVIPAPAKPKAGRGRGRGRGNAGRGR